MLRIVYILFLVIFLGCSPHEDNSSVYGSSKLIVNAQKRIETEKEICFKDTTLFLFIDWYNESTHEIKFIDQENILQFINHQIFLIKDSKNPFELATSFSSITINDLVLYYDIKSIYLTFGYPMNCDSCISEQREENKQKRNDDWEKFIDLLKRERKYRN